MSSPQPGAFDTDGHGIRVLLLHPRVDTRPARHATCGSLAESLFHCLPEMRLLDAAPGKKHDAVGAVPPRGSD